MKKFLFYLIIIFCLVAFLSWDNFSVQRVFKKILYKSQATLLLSLEKELTVNLDMPFHRQEHALSCEIAVLKMVLDYYRVNLPESKLLEGLPFDTRESRSKENIWGDPSLGFVGNIDGKSPNEGYGVYEQPIAQLASKYRQAKILQQATLSDILQEVVKKHPVIVWGSVNSGKDISWKTKEGKKIKAVFGEHARVVTGFSGTISNPKSILLLDPIYGARIFSKDKFLNDWALLDNKAVVVY